MTAHLVPCINEQCGALYLRGERSKAGYCPACRRPKTLEKLRNRSLAQRIREAKPRNTHCKACGAELPPKGRRDRKWCARWECQKHGVSPESMRKRNAHRPGRVRDRRKSAPKAVARPRIVVPPALPTYNLMPVRGADGKWRKSAPHEQCNAGESR